MEVRRIQEFIEQNFHQKILVEELAERFNLSRRTLERRFFRATANSLNEYIQRVRIEAAKKTSKLAEARFRR